MDPHDGRVVSNFICQALRGADITIYGNGAQTRSFCFVSDLIAGMVAMMNSDPAFTGPVNLGNPGEFTIAELAHKVLALIDTKSQLVYHELPSDDPKCRRPDISLAQTKLGWQPTISLDEGLQRSIPYFAARLTADGAL